MSLMQAINPASVKMALEAGVHLMIRCPKCSEYWVAPDHMAEHIAKTHPPGWWTQLLKGWA